MIKRYRLTALGAAAFLALGFAAWQAFWVPSAAQPAPSAVTRAQSIVGPFDRTMGSANAPVVLVEYAAPTCPYCAAFYLQYFQGLKTKYIDTGKVRYVYRVFLIHSGDGPAEKLSRCLPVEHYFDLVGLLFRRQPQWDADEYPNIDMHDGLMAIAKEIGLPKDVAEKCMASTALDRQLNQVSEEAEKKYKVNSTPTFLVNGVAGEGGEQWAHLEARLVAASMAK